MGKAKTPRVFVPLYKVDEEQRLVYGRITAEEVDQSGEQMDYDSSKPNFEKWSNDIHESTGGLSKGNVRVMHGLNVAGKLTELEFDDDNKAIEVCAKVVDEAEWNKVQEGCYTGFSVGGRYGKRWTEGGVKKFTAVPNEVSLVDNPCVKSATFSMFKADGAEELVEFQLPDDVKEELRKAAEEGESQEDAPAAEEPKAEPAPTGDVVEPTNDQVVAQAEKIAKALNDGTTWMDHVASARMELLKAAPSKKAKDDDTAGEAEAKSEDEGDEKKKSSSAEDKPKDKVAKTTPAGVKQQWTASDGTAFDKKADAEAHEETLAKAAEPLTDAEALQARMSKALAPADPIVVVGLMDDYERLGKVYNALSTPFGDDGQPVLEKGMYTVERFARLLWDMGKLTKSIAQEGAAEGEDSSDKQVAADIKKAIGDMGESFKAYAANQITELLAGIDDEAYVCYYDYYYAAAHSDGEDQLAKDVCSLLDEQKDSSRERREAMGEELTKAFGLELGSEESTDEVVPEEFQKRFDTLQGNYDSLLKVAEGAVEQIETLSKRMTELEESPVPRAPNGANVALREGDGNFLGKRADTEEERVAIVHDMVKNMGPEQVALTLIKAAQANGQVLTAGR